MEYPRPPSSNGQIEIERDEHSGTDHTVIGTSETMRFRQHSAQRSLSFQSALLYADSIGSIRDYRQIGYMHVNRTNERRNSPRMIGMHPEDDGQCLRLLIHVFPAELRFWCVVSGVIF